MKFTTLDFKALQNDIQHIAKKKFKVEKVMPVLEELNANGKNKEKSLWDQFKYYFE